MVFGISKNVFYVNNEINVVRKAESFERALELSKFGKFNVVIIFVSGLVLASVYLETVSISYVLPVSQCDLDWEIWERGVLSAIGFVGIIVSSHFWGFLADTAGRKTVILPTQFMGFFFSILSSFANSFWSLLILRFLNGVCISGGSAIIYAYLGEFHTAKLRARAIMCASIIFGVGCLMLPIFAMVIINEEWTFEIPLLEIPFHPWRLYMIVCSVPGLICGIAFYFFPESPKFLLSVNKEKESLEILKYIFRVNTGESKENYPVSMILCEAEDLPCKENSTKMDRNKIKEFVDVMWKQTSPLFNKDYIKNTSIICCLQFGIYSVSNGMALWLPDIVNSIAEYIKEYPNESALFCDIYNNKALILGNQTEGVHDTCVEKFGYLTFKFVILAEAIFVLGFVVFSILITNVPKLLLIFFTMIICGASGVAAILINIPEVSLYFYLAFICCGLASNVIGSVTVDIYPTRMRGMAVCISLMMGRLGCVFGVNFIGALISSYCEVSFITCSAILLVGGVMSLLIKKTTTSST